MTAPIAVGLSAVIVAADEEAPYALATRSEGGESGLPHGSFDPEGHRTFELGLRDWVRAQTRPYPGAFTYHGDEKVVVWAARPVPFDGAAAAGTVVAAGPGVACGEGALLIEELEPARDLPVGAVLG